MPGSGFLLVFTSPHSRPILCLVRLWTNDPISTLRESLATIAGQWVRATYSNPETAIAALGFGGFDSSGGAREMRRMLRDLFERPASAWWHFERPSETNGRDPVDVLVSHLMHKGAQLPGVVNVMRDVFFFTQVAAAELSIESEERAQRLRSGKPLVT